MTALLPPDPSVSGHYYLSHPLGVTQAFKWHIEQEGSGQWVAGNEMRYSPDYMGAHNFSLATPHRIPTAEELDAVYAALAEAPTDCKDPCPTVATYYIGLQHMAAKLRTALGGTP